MKRLPTGEWVPTFVQVGIGIGATGNRVVMLRVAGDDGASVEFVFSADCAAAIGEDMLTEAHNLLNERKANLQ